MNRIDALTDHILDSLSQSSVTGWPAGAGVETGASQERAKSVTDAVAPQGSVTAHRSSPLSASGPDSMTPEGAVARGCDEEPRSEPDACSTRRLVPGGSSRIQAAPLGEPGRISRLSPFSKLEPIDIEIASLEPAFEAVSEFGRKLDELDALIASLEVKRD